MDTGQIDALEHVRGTASTFQAMNLGSGDTIPPTARMAPKMQVVPAPCLYNQARGLLMCTEVPAALLTQASSAQQGAHRGALQQLGDDGEGQLLPHILETPDQVVTARQRCQGCERVLASCG